MAENKIVGYKNIFGFVLPDWVNEGTIRLMVTFLLSSAVMLFALIFFVWPKLADIKTMKQTLKASQESLESLKNSKSGFDKLSDQIPEATQDLVLSAIPTSYSPENAVFLLRKIASEIEGVSIVSYKLPSGVLFQSKDGNVSPGKNGTKDVVSFVNYPIKLTITAPVMSLLEFIERVESSLPIGVVSDMGMQEITKLSKSTTSKSVQMEIEVMYYQSLLSKVDISKVKPISTDDLSLVNKMSGYTKLSGAGVVEVSPSTELVGTSGSLFGF